MTIEDGMGIRKISVIISFHKDRVGSPEFSDFVNRIIQRGNYVDTEENIEQDDHLITLSTCYNDDRLVVTAVRCDECDND